MGAFAALRQHFTAKLDGLAPVDDRFIQIDREEARRRLKLDEQAEHYGLANEPQTSSLSLDAVEQDILSSISEHHERSRIDAHNNIRTYDERLSSLGLLDKLSSVRGSIHGAIADFRAETVVRRQRLTLARSAIVASFDELQQFQRDHRLRRPAHKMYPAIATNGAIFLAWFVEAAANSILLSQNDDQGLLGGFMAALVIAALNVGISAAVGRLAWPWAGHKDSGRRWAARSGIVIWIVALVFWNLLAGHYRDAKASGVDSPETVALLYFQTKTFALDTFYSIGLFILGILSGFGAAYAAYRKDDPYPGYGALYRRHEERCNDYANEIEDAREDLKKIRDAAVNEASETRAELGRQFRERGRILTARANFEKRFAQHEGSLEQTANALLSTYRAANRAARTTPAPARFDEPWSIERTELPQETSSFLSETEIAAVDADLEETSRLLNDAYVDAVESFEPLDTLNQRLIDGET